MHGENTGRVSDSAHCESGTVSTLDLSMHKKHSYAITKLKCAHLPHVALGQPPLGFVHLSGQALLCLIPERCVCRTDLSCKRHDT